MAPRRDQVDRRWLLGTIGTGATLAVAGCLDGSGDEGEELEDPEAEPDDDADAADEPEDDEAEDDDAEDVDELSLDEPAEFPTDEDEGECAVCNMVAAEYPDWNAQLAHEDGHRAYFCSKGCLVAYYYEPTAFSGDDTEEPVASAWATCFESGELIDAHEGTFVYEQDRDRHDFPMPRGSPLAFSGREAAVEYVEESEDLTEDEHVIDLADVDEEIAMFYRAPVLEDALES